MAKSSRVFSANKGQLDAGSTTTGSNFFPNKPPFLFCSSIIIKTVSFNVVSEMAMVPDKECNTPTLIVSLACAIAALNVSAATPTTLDIFLIIIFIPFE